MVHLSRRWWPFRRRACDAAAVGRHGEDLAYWFLRRQGYTIVARNYRAASRKLGGAGEIDLIAFEGALPTMVFIEVKARAQEGMFAAESAVNAAKRRHLIRVARGYRCRRHYTGPYRFDVVVIYGPDDKQPRLTLHRDAFRAPCWRS
ncbi:MAG: YraN family protein [Terriglobales bacterium]